MKKYLLFFLCPLLSILNLANSQNESFIRDKEQAVNNINSYEILGFGETCVDLLLSVDDDFLVHVPGEKGGSQLIEYDLLNHITQISGQTPSVKTGGSCANTIKSLACLKASCGFLSMVGSDAHGAFFATAFKKMGVKTLFHLSNKPTSMTLILITPDANRTMRFCPGSSRDISESMLEDFYFRDAKILHLESYLLHSGNVLEKAMQKAKQAGTKISLDLASFELVRKYKTKLLDLLSKYVDIVFANVDEVKSLLDLDPYEGCFELQKICPIAVVLTGKNGCLVGNKGKVFASPASKVTPIDTTGAGDYFAGGFLYKYVKGQSLEECAKFGNCLGGAITEVVGTDLSEKKWKELRKLAL